VKKFIAAFIAIVFMLPFYAAAAESNILDWQQAVNLLDNYNNTLLNMKVNVVNVRKQYINALMNAESIDTKGMTISVMGKEMYILFDENMKMGMTLRKEFFPEQMKLNWEMSDDIYRITRNRMITGLRGMFLSLYSSSKNQDIKMRRYELQKQIHEQNKLKFEKGMISKTDLEESEYNLLAAKAASDSSKRNLENAMRNFNNYVGIDPDIVFEKIVLNEKYEEKRLRNLDYYLERAVTQRHDVILKKKQLALLELKKDIMERFPMNMNVVSIREEYEDLMNEIGELQTRIEIERLNIEKDLKEAYLQTIDTGRKVMEMKKKMDLQRNSLEKTYEMYEKGLIPKTTVDQMQLGYEELELSYLSILFDYNTKLMRLENAAGLGPAYQEG
jgi:hypothetical protein